MGARLLPRNLPELFSYSLVIEREAARRYTELEGFLRGRGEHRLADELEKLGREEREQYEIIVLGTAGRELPELVGWELGWYYGEDLQAGRVPNGTADALAIALAFERRTQAFYNDVAANARADAVRAFAAEMSADEQRHIARLEELLAREDAFGAAGEDETGEADGVSLP